VKQSYRVLLWMLAACLWAPMTGAASGPRQFEAGLHYHLIDPPMPLAARPGRVEVVELFLYACPHCYQLEPKMKRWLKRHPEVDFHRVPAIVGPTWADQARAFYMIEALGGGEAMHQALFRAIHEDGRQIYNRYAVIDFLVSQGVDRKRAGDLYYSKDIADQVDKARILTVKYGLRGVPAVAVDGRYLTAPYFVRDQDEMFKVLDQLVAAQKARLAPVATSGEQGKAGPARVH